MGMVGNRLRWASLAAKLPSLTSHVHEVLQYIYHSCHLAEDEDTVTQLFEPLEELVQQDHL